MARNQDAVKGLGDYSGLILSDSANPLGMEPDGLGLTLWFDSSGGEQVAGGAKCAGPLKAFNTTGTTTWRIRRASG